MQITNSFQIAEIVLEKETFPELLLFNNQKDDLILMRCDFAKMMLQNSGKGRKNYFVYHYYLKESSVLLSISALNLEYF